MQVPGATQLYQYQAASGEWELASPDVNPHFFNPNQDQRGAQTCWSLEAYSMELAVTDSYSYQSSAQRVTLSDVETGQIWALKFPSMGAAEQFVEDYTQKLFENTYSKPYTPANFQKVLPAKQHLACLHAVVGAVSAPSARRVCSELGSCLLLTD